MNDGLTRKNGKAACNRCGQIEPELIVDSFIDEAGGYYRQECRCKKCNNRIIFVGNRKDIEELRT